MTLKKRALALVDRRTIVCFISLGMLFVLALRGEERPAIEAISGIVWIAIGLAGANAAQKSLHLYREAKREERGAAGKSSVARRNSAEE